MASCLGLDIQENLIKYAKVTKDRDNLKVEAFGVKFYDELNTAIDQIVAETFSYKTPISVNSTNENYNYFYMFSLLSKNDLKKSIETEFDSFCYDKGFNRNSLEARYALVPDLEDKQKIKVIHISNNKLDINKKIQEMGENTLGSIIPLPMAITNIFEAKEKENILVVNIEDKTTVTTIIDQKIYNIDIIENGSLDFLNSISQKENSYAKAYEICKNTTIYTMEGRDLQEGENLYLQDIMPSLYNIVESLKQIIENAPEKIGRIYITGTAAVINNIDLYFQEYFTNCNCEILRPYFIPETVKINMKDYIEVNSAIALGMQGLGYGIKNINFKNPALVDKLPDFLKITSKPKKDEAGNGNKDKAPKQKKNFSLGKLNLSLDLKGTLDNAEKWLIRCISGILAFVIIYSSFAIFISSVTDKKIQETEDVKKDTDSQIQQVQADIDGINDKATEYSDLLETIKNLRDEQKENKKVKHSIPNFLTALMYAVPKRVSIRSITNTSGYTIRVIAQSDLYSQLAYLIGAMKTSNMLYDVTVSASVKDSSDIITVVIEGSLFPE